MRRVWRLCESLRSTLTSQSLLSVRRSSTVAKSSHGPSSRNRKGLIPDSGTHFATGRSLALPYSANSSTVKARRKVDRSSIGRPSRQPYLRRLSSYSALPVSAISSPHPHHRLPHPRRGIRRLQSRGHALSARTGGPPSVSAT